MLESTSHMVVTDPYLKGNHAAVCEEVDLRDLPVRGKLPDDMAGIYMRNGPNPKYEPIAYSYPFDGDGMIHAVHFEGGKARYRNRFVQTPGLAAEDRAGKALYGSLVAPVPVDGALLEPGEPDMFKNVANINVIRHGGHYLALYEADGAFEIDAEGNTLGRFDFGGEAPTMAAHPRFDPKTGEMHFFTYDMEPPYLTYLCADSSAQVTAKVPFDLAAPMMVHDFVITETRVLFFLCPVIFDFSLPAKGQSPLLWRPEQGTAIVSLDRANPDAPADRIETDPFWVFHFANAYDRGPSEVVVDFVQHEFLASGTGEDENPNPTMFRAVLDFEASTAKGTPIGDPATMVEFPRFNDALDGRPYRHAYATESESKGMATSIVQFDVDTGESRRQAFDGRRPGEACFVPRPAATGEDDGYVITFVYDEERGASDVVLVDAADFDGEPVATIELPVRVPYGLHGNWMALEEG